VTDPALRRDEPPPTRERGSTRGRRGSVLETKESGVQPVFAEIVFAQQKRKNGRATHATLAATTNENATCGYASPAGVPYPSMTSFATTGGTSHSTTISGLTNGTSYTYFVKCRDAAGNISQDASTSFSVAHPHHH
jgi:hypothetical protein